MGNGDCVTRQSLRQLPIESTGTSPVERERGRLYPMTPPSTPSMSPSLSLHHECEVSVLVDKAEVEGRREEGTAASAPPPPSSLSMSPLLPTTASSLTIPPPQYLHSLPSTSAAPDTYSNPPSSPEESLEESPEVATVSRKNVPSSPRPHPDTRQRSVRWGLSLHRRILLIMNLVLLCSIRTHARITCFNTGRGNSIAGSNYHRVRGVEHKDCAVECRDDPSCLAYEWNAALETCYLKSRSLSGPLERNEDTIVGFCLDDNEELRDRFYDHEIEGPVTVQKEDIEGDECRGFCATQEKASIYSWRPADPSDDESTIGICKCIESIRSLTLNFNTFSGFLPSSRPKFR